MKVGGFLWRLFGRWFTWKDQWMPMGLICRIMGHGETFWYDGEWCCRCGGRAEIS
jgi:hypothetical protein